MCQIAKVCARRITLEIAGHRTGEVGKCHLSGAKHFILQAVGNLRKF